MRFHHYGMEVTNLAESVEFYKSTLGFTEENRMFFMGEEIVFLISGNTRVELVSGGIANSKTTHICFEVNNLNQAMERMKSGQIIEGPYKLPNGWETVFYEGPGGEIVEFLQKPTLLK